MAFLYINRGYTGLNSSNKANQSSKHDSSYPDVHKRIICSSTSSSPLSSASSTLWGTTKTGSRDSWYSKSSNSKLFDSDERREQLLATLPKPVFHANIQPSANKRQRANKQPNITQEHSEMIKYIEKSWKCVEPNYKRTGSFSDKSQQPAACDSYFKDDLLIMERPSNNSYWIIESKSTR